jgi:hypothetical protein
VFSVYRPTELPHRSDISCTLFTLPVSLQCGYFTDFRKVIVTSLQESQRTLVYLVAKQAYRNLMNKLSLDCQFLLPIPAAAKSKAWVYGCSLAEIVGSNLAEVMDSCLLWVLCVVRGWSLESYLLWCVQWVWSRNPVKGGHDQKSDTSVTGKIFCYEARICYVLCSPSVVHVSVTARRLFIACVLYGRVVHSLWSAKWNEVAFLEPKNISIGLALPLWITYNKPLLTWCVMSRHISVGTFCYNTEFCLCGLDEAGIN